MSEWKTVRLGDVFDLQMGKTPERKNLDFFSTTDNKWISIADISKADKYIFETINWKNRNYKRTNVFK